METRPTDSGVPLSTKGSTRYASDRSPTSGDTIRVSRRRLEHLHRHLTCSYRRFPTRHLRQSLQILQHLLITGDRPSDR